MTTSDSRLCQRARRLLRQLDELQATGVVTVKPSFDAVFGERLRDGDRLLPGGLSRAYVGGAAMALRWMLREEEI